MDVWRGFLPRTGVWRGAVFIERRQTIPVYHPNLDSMRFLAAEPLLPEALQRATMRGFGGGRPSGRLKMALPGCRFARTRLRKCDRELPSPVIRRRFR